MPTKNSYTLEDTKGTLDKLQRLGAEGWPSFTQTITKRAGTRIQKILLKRIKKRPGRPRHPLRWAPSRHPEDAGKKPNTRFGYYSRQKAAYFATNGFGAGIPYRPTGKLASGWSVKVDLSQNSASIGLTNSTPYSEFVQGEFRQPFHLDTGWETGDEVIVDLIPTIDGILEETLVTVVDEFAGVK